MIANASKNGAFAASSAQRREHFGPAQSTNASWRKQRATDDYTHPLRTRPVSGVGVSRLQRRPKTDPIRSVSEIHAVGCRSRTKQRRDGWMVIHAVAA